MISDLKLKNLVAWIHWKRKETPPMHEDGVGFVNDIEGLIARMKSAEDALKFYADRLHFSKTEVTECGAIACLHFDKLKEKK